MFRIRPCSAALLWLLAPAAPAQTFHPEDFGTVTLHLQAGGLALANNAPVPAWGPLTAAGSSRPVFIVADPRFNDQPVVKFDGLNDVLTWSAANLSARTIFAVAALESAAPSLAGLLSNGNDGLNIRRNGTASTYRSPTAAQDTNDFTGNGSPTGSLSVNDGPGSGYTPGVPHVITATAGSLKNYSTLWIGNASSSLPRYWNGSVAEILIYDGVLTPSAINSVGFYLQEKYRLPTGFISPDPIVTSFTGTTPAGVTSGQGILSTPGAPVTLRWTTDQSTAVTLDQGISLPPPSLAGTVIVSPSVTTTYTLTAVNAAAASAARTLTVHIGATPLPPGISEFSADNESGLTDTDGSHPDWIEIHNPNPYGIDLQGLRLSDSTSTWDFPPGSGIAALGYRLVLADSKNLVDPSGTLHSNFNLNNNGESLSLRRIADGAVLSEFFPAYPPQYADTSYGYFGDPPMPGYFSVPTPGAPNGNGVLGFLDRTDDTKFTAGRGFYSAAVTTTISASTPGATLVYTTNGTVPTLTNGTVVPAADAVTPPSVTLTIHPAAVPAGASGVNLASIGGVTTLRAAAFLTGYEPTNTDTQTYFFTSLVLTQTPAQSVARGWPSSPVNGQLFNFGMDPNVVNSFTAAEMEESLHSLPSLSIVTDQKNLTDSATGIYVNADQHGSAWERPVSLELIHPPGYVSPDGNPAGFQIDAGLRARGGYSRNDQFFKHGLRLFFSKRYDGKLRYPLFGTEGATEFGKVDLGTGSNYAWYRESSYSNGRFNTMVRDPFCRDTQGALGQPHTRSRYYHLYLNGSYWGLYYTEERAEAEYAESYFGGDASEYDAVKCGNHVANFQTEATDGTLDAWQSLWNKTRAIKTTGATLEKYFDIEGRNPDGTRNPALPVLLDIDNLIDEMLVIFFSGDGDAVLSNFLGHDRPNNWFSVYRRTGTAGFRFFIRDSEHTLGAPSWVADQTGPWGGSYVNDFTYSNPQRMHQDLMASPEYRLRFADHVRRHFFDGGALTPAVTRARFQARADQLANAMRAESARWGDAQSISGLPAGHPPRYIVADWTAAIALVQNSILPNRTTVVLNQLKADALYPALAAPSFLDTQDQPVYQASAPATFTLRLTAPAGTLYYTLDGTDPRLPGGAIAPGALTGTSPVEISLTRLTRVSARAWQSDTVWSALTTGDYYIGALADSTNLVISQLQYRPATADGLAEFLELMNISGSPIDLSRCTFSAGIRFTFPDGFSLNPGARTLLVRDSAAFQAAYPSVPASQIAGVFAEDTALSNSGETIELQAAGGSVIQRFTYNNKPPWPVEADGGGPSLVLLSPTLNPDPDNPWNWRRSLGPDGLPGATDAIAYSAWISSWSVPAPESALEADPDHDGLPNLMEYVLGNSPLSASSPPLVPLRQILTVGSVTAPWLTATLVRRPGYDGAGVTVEAADDPAGPWVPAIPAGNPAPLPDGTVSQLYRHPDPSLSTRQFLRLRARMAP